MELEIGDIIQKKIDPKKEKYIIIDIEKGIMQKLNQLAENAKNNLRKNPTPKLGDLICKRVRDEKIGRLFSAEVKKVDIK